jgi:hypothetical protein
VQSLERVVLLGECGIVRYPTDDVQGDRADQVLAIAEVPIESSAADPCASRDFVERCIGLPDRAVNLSFGRRNPFNAGSYAERMTARVTIRQLPRTKAIARRRRSAS